MPPDAGEHRHAPKRSLSSHFESEIVPTRSSKRLRMPNASSHGALDRRQEIDGMLTKLTFIQQKELLVLAISKHSDIAEAVRASIGAKEGGSELEDNQLASLSRRRSAKGAVSSISSTAVRPGSSSQQRPSSSSHEFPDPATAVGPKLQLQFILNPMPASGPYAASVSKKDGQNRFTKVSADLRFPEFSRIYYPKADEQWWYRTPEQLNGMSRKACYRRSHIGRIMETPLGECLADNDRWARCRSQGLQCWRYTAEARSQIKNGTSTCAQCREAMRECVYPSSRDRGTC
jgi:hypothetical protein